MDVKQIACDRLLDMRVDSKVKVSRGKFNVGSIIYSLVCYDI